MSLPLSKPIGAVNGLLSSGCCLCSCGRRCRVERGTSSSTAHDRHPSTTVPSCCSPVHLVHPWVVFMPSRTRAFVVSIFQPHPKKSFPRVSPFFRVFRFFRHTPVNQNAKRHTLLQRGAVEELLETSERVANLRKNVRGNGHGAHQRGGRGGGGGGGNNAPNRCSRCAHLAVTLIVVVTSAIGRRTFRGEYCCNYVHGEYF